MRYAAVTRIQLNPAEGDFGEAINFDGHVTREGGYPVPWQVVENVRLSAPQQMIDTRFHGNGKIMLFPSCYMSINFE